MTTNNFDAVYERFVSLREELGEAECLKIAPNEYQRAFIDSNDTQKFAFGGNRSGKTLMLVYILFLMACGLYTPRGNKKKRRYNVWLSSLDANLTKQVIIPLMKKIIPDGWLKINENRNWARIVSTFGITIKIDFKSADAGREKYQGASVDFIGLDEEHPEDIYKECLMRILDVQGQILTTMTPLLGVTWIFAYSQSHFNITFPTNANPILKQKDIDELSAGFTDKEKEMRLFGKFVDLSGAQFLDGDDKDYIQRTVEVPQTRKTWSEKFENFIPDATGEFAVYREFKDDKGKVSITGRVFIVTCDPATGSGQDYTVIDVWENSDKLNLVAQFRSNTTKLPAIPKMIKRLALEYGNATVNIDRTGGTGEGVLQGLVDQGYFNISGRENFDQFVTVDKLGFTFTPHNRNIAIIELRKRIQNRTIVMRSKQAYQELILYRYDLKQQRYDHPRQSNDDTIMSAVLAVMTARLLPMSRSIIENRTKFFSFTEGITFKELMEMDEKMESEKQSDDVF